MLHHPSIQLLAKYLPSNKLNSLQLTPPPLHHLPSQHQPLGPRPAPVLRIHHSTFQTRAPLRPPPERLKRGIQSALQRVDDLVADDGEELVAVAAAAGGEEEPGVGWVVGDYEVAFGTVDVC